MIVFMFDPIFCTSTKLYTYFVSYFLDDVKFLGWCQKRIFNTGILKIILENMLDYTGI